MIAGLVAPRKRDRDKTLPARSPAAAPGTKLSPHARNSPFRRVLPEQGELFHARAANRPRRETFVPHSGPVPVQNSPRTQPGGRYRYKTLPAYEPHALNRYKTLPARPKAPISAHFPHAGRVLYRSHHQQAEQGEESHAPAPHRAPPTHPPPIPHAIRLHEISTTSRNVAIPTITFQLLKYSEGNCMRNWLRSQQ